MNIDALNKSSHLLFSSLFEYFLTLLESLKTSYSSIPVKISVSYLSLIILSPSINVEPTKLKEQTTPTLWSFEISTGVWSRVQLVEAVVPTHHIIPAMADNGSRQTLWPAARTAAISVGESCTHSGASSGHSRDGIGAGWLLGGHGDRECADNEHHKHSDQQKHYLAGLWRLAVVGKEQRAETPAIV